MKIASVDRYLTALLQGRIEIGSKCPIDASQAFLSLTCKKGDLTVTRKAA